MLFLKIVKLVLYPSMIISCYITFQECKNFSFFQGIKRLFDFALVEVMSYAVRKNNLFVEFLMKSKSKELI